MCPGLFIEAKRISKAYLSLIERNSNLMNTGLKALLRRESESKAERERDGLHANRQRHILQYTCGT